MPTTKKRKKSLRTPREATIQKAILNWLKGTELLHWRQNSGLLFIGKRRVILGTSGLPDIIVIVPDGGKFVGLEVKSAKGKLRPSQEKFRDRIQAVGGSYHVVRSVADAKAALYGEGAY